MAEERKLSRKRRARWMDREAHALIHLWRKRGSEYHSTHRKIVFYQMLSDEMAKLSYVISPREIQNKIHNLRSRFRVEEINIAQGKPSYWPFFNILFHILRPFEGCSFVSENEPQDFIDLTNDSDDENYT